MNAIIDRIRESADASQFGANNSVLTRPQPASDANITSSVSQRKPNAREGSWDQSSSSDGVARSNSFHTTAPFAFFTRTHVTRSVASPAALLSLGLPPQPTQIRPRSETSAEAGASASGSGLSLSMSLSSNKYDAVSAGGRSQARAIGVARREPLKKNLSLRLPGAASSSPVYSDSLDIATAFPKRPAAFTLPQRGCPLSQTVSLPITARTGPAPPPSARFLERTASFIEQADIDTLNSLLAVINSRKRRLQEVRVHYKRR